MKASPAKPLTRKTLSNLISIISKEQPQSQAPQAAPSTSRKPHIPCPPLCLSHTLCAVCLALSVVVAIQTQWRFGTSVLQFLCILKVRAGNLAPTIYLVSGNLLKMFISFVPAPCVCVSVCVCVPEVSTTSSRHPRDAFSILNSKLALAELRLSCLSMENSELKQANFHKIKLSKKNKKEE